jgi:acetylornithine/succinyldiaminopimelate/putrescine aminotransferase
MTASHPFLETCKQMLREETPNFLRLYIGAHVAGVCLCLNRYVQETWHAGMTDRPDYQSFLANSFDEALSGAIKLARFSADVQGRPKAGLVINPAGRLGPLASVTLDNQGRIDFIPDLLVIGQDDHGDAAALARDRRFGFVVLFPPAGQASVAALDALGPFGQSPAPLVITCVDRNGLAHCSQEASVTWRKLRPDIVVFDESFVRGHIPFGAFTARASLYRYWNARGYTTFHSTTYQPNAISTLHFLRCLEQDDPAFFARLAPQLERLASDPAYRKSTFARLYNPSLSKAVTAVGWDRRTIRASGHHVTVDGKPIFDGVAGVACSIRGHNPANYPEEIARLGDRTDYRQAVAERLQRLTGLPHVLPAVSGASAVENALRIGLAAQYPRNYVLAFTGGFGGKTLLALAGTAKSSYKERLDPLYDRVVYVNPYLDSAIADIEAALDNYPVGVVQTELIQAVGGVRALPEKVLRHLQAEKERRGYLLFVDEVQTGMYRTGPFIRSTEVGIEPDLLTIGKGTSDMMVPFAVTLYSQRVQAKLHAQKTDLPEVIRQRFDYEFGYKTLLNVLERSEEGNVSEHVRESGTLFTQLLAKGLSSCKTVHDVRTFGLLIAIELNTKAWPLRWVKKQAGSLYVLHLLRHKSFPVFMGYCQYEPHVLKFTPPLSITREEIYHVSETITAVLRRPAYALLPSLVGALAASSVKGKWERYRNGRAHLEHSQR